MRNSKLKHCYWYWFNAYNFSTKISIYILPTGFDSSITRTSDAHIQLINIHTPYHQCRFYNTLVICDAIRCHFSFPILKYTGICKCTTYGIRYNQDDDASIQYRNIKWMEFFYPGFVFSRNLFEFWVIN